MNIGSWIVDVFADFDFTVLQWLHEFALRTNGNLNGVFKGMSMLCSHFIGVALIAVVLTLFSRTRRAGSSALFALVLAYLLMTVVKGAVLRPRPYAAGEIYEAWWQFAGAIAEKGSSFPSGHAAATMAVMGAIFLNSDKKTTWLLFIVVFLMCVSRCYLFVHYPTDVLAGVILGGVCAWCGSKSAGLLQLGKSYSK